MRRRRLRACQFSDARAYCVCNVSTWRRSLVWSDEVVVDDVSSERERRSSSFVSRFWWWVSMVVWEIGEEKYLPVRRSVVLLLVVLLSRLDGLILLGLFWTFLWMVHDLKSCEIFSNLGSVGALVCAICHCGIGEWQGWCSGFCKSRLERSLYRRDEVVMQRDDDARRGGDSTMVLVKRYDTDEVMLSSRQYCDFVLR